MMKKLLIFALLFISAVSYGAPKKIVRGVRPDEIQPFTDKVAQHLCTRANTVHPLEVDAVYYYKDKTVEIYFSSALSEQPLRIADVEWLYSTAKTMLAKKFPKCAIKIYTDKKPVEQLVSRWYSKQWYRDGIWDSEAGKKALQAHSRDFSDPSSGRYSFVKSSSSKLDTVKVSYIGHSSGMGGSSTASGNSRQWVRSASDVGIRITSGLDGKNIALWDSHGLFYNSAKNKWTWQRPHLFQTCEDLLTSDIALNYLVPMLENAGAYVVMPKERDFQTAEVIVDDESRGYSEKGSWSKAPHPGYGASKRVCSDGDNPFRSGSARQVSVNSGRGGYACWKPKLPKAGEYAVYVSYLSLPSGTTAAYTVHHCGQKSTFYVNQRMGGGTWVYLGTFFFDDATSGGDEIRNGVTLSAKAVPGVQCSGKEVITADAVKFGGGMGSISRKGSLSGVPRYMEGARYWLQYAGYPENMYSPFDSKNDYKDDYSSRALWVNALSGGSESNPYMSGYGVPVDLSFALHTDAGISKNDSIVGSLAIYTSRSNGREYLADGRSRFINRELCDIIQTQVVEDIRACLDESWNRRGMWDKSYFECREPEVPAMILELMSHQNLADMRLAMDPLFKFTVARAIYKGMLSFFKATRGDDFQVQPMPVTSFCAQQRDGRAYLTWQPSSDPLEPSAVPEGYMIYRREVDVASASEDMLLTPDRYFGFEYEGFTEGTEYFSPVSLEDGRIYSYKVVAVNSGGASFPSEVLSVCTGRKGRALTINCFDRLSAPESFGLTDPTAGGFLTWKDRGVGYKRDISYAGDQYSFGKDDEYVNDDHPGFGACRADYDTLIACGNTFDYTLIHCAAICRAGYGCSSCSRSALGDVATGDYSVIDVIGGKQKGGGRYEPVLSFDVIGTLRECAGRGGCVIASGAHLLSDVSGDTESLDFITNVLKMRSMGSLRPSGVESFSKDGFVTALPSAPNRNIYTLESVDAIFSTDKKSKILMRYSGYGPAACIVYSGKDYKVICAGFPLEVSGHLYEIFSSVL